MKLPQPFILPTNAGTGFSRTPFAAFVRAINDASHKPGDGRPTIFAWAAALAALAGLAGRHVRLDGDKPCNLYIVALGESGAGKDDCFNAMQRVVAASLSADELAAVSDRLHAPASASNTATMRQLADSKAMLQFESEWGATLGRICSPRAQPNDQGSAEAYLKLFDMTRCPGKRYAREADNIPAIDAPSLTVYGGTTPSRFFDGVSADMIEGGLLSRVLVFELTDGIRVNDRPHVLPQQQMVDFVRVVRDVNAARTVDVTEDARRLFLALDEKYVSGIGNRAGLLARRIAALTSLYDTLTGVVDVYHARLACHVCDTLTQRLIARMTNSPQAQAVDEREQLALDAIDSMCARDGVPVTLTGHDARSLAVPDGTRVSAVPWRALSNRLRGLKRFANQRRGPVEEVRATLRELGEADAIVEVRVGRQSYYARRPRGEWDGIESV